MNNASNQGDLRHPPFILERTKILMRSSPRKTRMPLIWRDIGRQSPEKISIFFQMGNKSNGVAVYLKFGASIPDIFDIY
jgi:hypothetical protein